MDTDRNIGPIRLDSAERRDLEDGYAICMSAMEKKALQHGPSSLHADTLASIADLAERIRGLGPEDGIVVSRTERNWLRTFVNAIRTATFERALAAGRETEEGATAWLAIRRYDEFAKKIDHYPQTDVAEPDTVRSP